MAVASEAARQKLGVVLDIVLSLEKEEAYDSALKRATKEYDALKNTEGADKLAAAIERLKARVDAKENAEATRDVKAIRELAAGGSHGEALAKAIAAVDKYTGTSQAATFVKLLNLLPAP